MKKILLAFGLGAAAATAAGYVVVVRHPATQATCVDGLYEKKFAAVDDAGRQYFACPHPDQDLKAGPFDNTFECRCKR